MAKMKAHPYAEMFPMMTATELDALAEDIAANGLRHPVVKYQGQVLDGRNRLLACEKAEVEPTFTEHEGDDASAFALVISLNVQRRDLTAGQRAIAAAKSLEHMPKRRGRPEKGALTGHNNGKSRDNIAAVFKVGKNQVQQSKALLINAPDLAARVESGDSLEGAYKEYREREKEAARRKKDLERVGQYADAVHSGEMSLEEALQKVVEEERAEKESAQHDQQARELWFDRLKQIQSIVQDSISNRTDEHLTWYTEGEALPPISEDEVAECIAQLQRVLTITYGGKTNVKTRGSSTRTRSA